MASPVRNVAARYIEALPENSPIRSPLAQTNKFNIGSPKKPEKRGKLASPDLDDLARQMNIETPKKTDFLRAKFETPSATVSSFQTTPSVRVSTSKPESSRISNLDIPLENVSPSKIRNSANSSDSKAYEYLCRISAIRNWLQVVLHEEIPQSAAELISHIRNGIYLAKLANVFLPQKKQVFSQDARLEFRHTENINRFFKLVKYLEIPDVFQFELTDLYDAKDVPKVWFCLHAIIYKINAMNPEFPAMENLVGKLEFTPADLKIATRALVGHQLPNFASADNTHTGSPGTSAYMNKTLSVASPSKSPSKGMPFSSMQNRGQESENPFLEKAARLSPSSPAPSYKLNSVKTPDLSVRRVQPDPISESPIQFHNMDTSNSYYRPELESQMVHIHKLQALCKGSALRYTMFVRKIMLRSYDTELTEFFSIIRGNLTRAKTVHRHRGEVLLHEKEILQLQATARMRLAQRKRQNKMVSAEEKSVEKLQSLIRGYSVRSAAKRDSQKLKDFSDSITLLQCRIRAKSIYRNVSLVSLHRDEIEGNIIQLQSHARRSLYLSEKNKSIVSHLESDVRLVELQSLIRGANARNQVRARLRVLFNQTSNLSELQNIARGAITRTRLCNNVLITLMGEDIKMNELFAKARGNFLRAHVSHKKEALENVEHTQITELQSVFRGILVRFHQSIDTEDVYENVDHLIGLQAKVRANAVRSRINEMKHYYSRRVDKVVRAQAVLRSKYTQNAYKAFTMMKNPPVDVVRKFAHLLSDSGTDFEEEIELTRLKDEIMEKSKNNEDLETQIESLDIKLGLLDKNKITVEDFVKNQNKFKTYKPVSQSAGAIKSLEGLNKTAKERIELYSSMFYFLQTNPSYWLRLYEIMSPQDPNRPLKNLHLQVSQLFSLARIAVHANSREEFFFVKLVCALMKSDMQTRCHNVAEITKISSSFWIPYLLELHNQTPQRTHLKRLFGKVIEKVIDDDEVSYESNPTRIHELIRTQEINVHGRSDRSKTVTPQVAIKDEDVSSQFVRNLMALRDTASEFMECLKAGVSHLPLHVRIVAKAAYKLSQVRFPENSDQSHLSVAGVIVIKHYVSNLMQNPGHFGYSTQDPISSDGHNPTRTSDNLKYLSRVLLQVFSMKAFSDSFMKPLNDFVVSQVEATKDIIREIIDVRDMEVEYEMNDYDDLVSHDRPQLTMRASDMIALEKLISRNLDIVVPGMDDQLYPIVNELNELANSSNDFVTLTEMGSITLALSPASHELSAADSKTKNLLAQAKRCLLYIMQVQDGNELLELFVRGIKPAHETKFREIVAGEIQESLEKRSTSMPYARSSLGDMSEMSYVSLKKMALKVILELESLGVVTRKDSFQELLNQVVVDIKTKDTRRRSRKSELLVAGQTVAKLGEKEMFLKRQLNDYNKHIDRMLTEVQTRPKEKKLFNIIPVFSKQYFYHRQLKKHNRLPKFGSYKYSAKKLMEQGVLYDIGGALYRKGATSSKVEFMFSCHKAGVFVIEAANGAINIPGACNTITLDQVLEQQYAHAKTWVMFDGMVTFDTEALASLIFRNFYDIRRD